MAATATATRRLLHEYKQLVNDCPEGICAGPVSEDDFFEWECFIHGPEGTPFEGGVYSATLSFPKVCFVYLFFHLLLCRHLQI